MNGLGMIHIDTFIGRGALVIGRCPIFILKCLLVGGYILVV